MSSRQAEGYRLVEGAPSVEHYLALRERSGLTPKSREQASAALPGSWAACHVVQRLRRDRSALDRHGAPADLSARRPPG